MSTQVRRRDGGYATFPNRWIDAGYMAKAPGSVTQVYFFLCRWADNATLEAAQPMRTIAYKCGISEDVARKAVRSLEAWGVITRESRTGPHATNVWTLNNLPDGAPDYPDKLPPKQSGGTPTKSPPTKLGTYQPDVNQPDSVSETSSDTGDGEASPPNPTRQILDAYLHATGLNTFTNWGAAGSAAKALAKAGFTAEDIPRMVAWAMKDKWLANNLTINNLASKADAYRIASAAHENKPHRLVV